MDEGFILSAILVRYSRERKIKLLNRGQDIIYNGKAKNIPASLYSKEVIGLLSKFYKLIVQIDSE